MAGAFVLDGCAVATVDAAGTEYDTGHREALRLATVDGARCLGREAEIGSLEPGKRADAALWRVDGPLHGDIDDPVTALVLGPRPPLELLLVEGRPVVENDELRTVSAQACGADLRAVHRRLAGRLVGGAR